MLKKPKPYIYIYIGWHGLGQSWIILTVELGCWTVWSFWENIQNVLNCRRVCWMRCSCHHFQKLITHDTSPPSPPQKNHNLCSFLKQNNYFNSEPETSGSSRTCPSRYVFGYPWNMSLKRSWNLPYWCDESYVTKLIISRIQANEKLLVQAAINQKHNIA